MTRTKHLQRSKLYRYWGTPRGQRARYAIHRDYIAPRPFHNRLYRLRIRCDAAWESGNPEARRYLTSLGYRPSEACASCGATKATQAFWPDYRRPMNWYRLCPVHRKVQASKDARTVEEVNHQLAEVWGRMTAVYRTLKRFVS